MLIKNIEQRIKINKIVSLASIAFAVLLLSVVFSLLTESLKIPENPFTY